MEKHDGNKSLIENLMETGTRMEVHKYTNPYTFFQYTTPFGPQQSIHSPMVGIGWLRLAGSIKLYVSFAKEPYKRDDILQKRPVI